MIVSCKNIVFNQITLLCYISYEIKKNSLNTLKKIITYTYYSRSYGIKKIIYKYI